MNEILKDLFGTDFQAFELTLLHLSMRGFFVYFAGLTLARLQSQFISISTPFNYMLNFIIGSLLANAIVGDGPYFPTLCMCFFIFLMNLLIEILCYYSPFLEGIFKGSAAIIVKDGKVIWKNMRKNFLTYDELIEAVHRQIHQSTLENVKYAYFENNGEITVIEK